MRDLVFGFIAALLLTTLGVFVAVRVTGRYMDFGDIASGVLFTYIGGALYSLLAFFDVCWGLISGENHRWSQYRGTSFEAAATIAIGFALFSLVAMLALGRQEPRLRFVGCMLAFVIWFVFVLCFGYVMMPRSVLL